MEKLSFMLFGGLWVHLEHLQWVFLDNFSIKAAILEKRDLWQIRDLAQEVGHQDNYWSRTQNEPSKYNSFWDIKQNISPKCLFENLHKSAILKFFKNFKSRALSRYMLLSYAKVWKRWVLWYLLGLWVNIVEKKRSSFDCFFKKSEKKRVGVLWFYIFDLNLRILGHTVLSVGFLTHGRTDARTHRRKVILYPPLGSMTPRGIKKWKA